MSIPKIVIDAHQRNLTGGWTPEDIEQVMLAVCEIQFDSKDLKVLSKALSDSWVPVIDWIHDQEWLVRIRDPKDSRKVLASIHAKGPTCFSRVTAFILAHLKADGDKLSSSVRGALKRHHISTNNKGVWTYNGETLGARTSASEENQRVVDPRDEVDEKAAETVIED